MGDLDPACTLATYHMYAYIKNSRWAPVQGTVNGASWIELYATYRIAGGITNDKAGAGSIYQEHTGLLQDFRAFKHLFLGVVHTYVHLMFRFLFSPARVSEARLAVYGISPFMARMPIR